MDILVLVSVMLVVSISIAFLLLWLKYSKLRWLSESLSEQNNNTNNKIALISAEQERWQSQFKLAELFLRLVDQSPNAIMLMDPDGNIISVNVGFTKMYEYTYTEFVNALGKNYRKTSFSPNVEQRLSTIARTKQPIRYEALNITKTGKLIWTQTALMPILDQEGKITHLVTIDTDINQRVIKSDNLIREMEELNSKIDNLVGQFKLLDQDFRTLFQSISDLYLLIEKTDQILRFIKEISDKTKILGFNASIEASRAGEHGRGFRIITNEIVDISEKTLYSIKQINEILDNIREKQNELMGHKDDSENRLTIYQEIFSHLKKEVVDIEASISEFKSMT
jgi:PAS domain S-box-containing protein